MPCKKKTARNPYEVESICTGRYWREALARLGLHALVRFDSVAPPEDGERRLYESLALLLENSREQLERLIADQQAQRLARQQSAARLIAELLIDCAACRRKIGR